jgi:hypothetical protein
LEAAEGLQLIERRYPEAALLSRAANRATQTTAASINGSDK